MKPLRSFLRRPSGVLLAAAVSGAIAFAAAGTEPANQPLQGVLIDQQCSSRAESRVVSDPQPHIEGGMLWAYTHTKSCLLMPACQRSGYGIFTYESDEFVPFDAAGNAKARAFLQTLKKDDDVRVEVTGQRKGKVFAVSTIKLL